MRDFVLGTLGALISLLLMHALGVIHIGGCP